MTDVVRSMIRLPWAASLFAVRQTAELLSAFATARSPRRAAASFDAVAAAAAGQLDGALGQTYRDGERWLGELIDAVFDGVDPALDLSREVARRTLVRGSFATLRRSADVLAAAMPSSARGGWQEVRNKLEAFEHFQFAEEILAPAGESLAGRVEDAEGFGPYLGLWLTEGLGYAFAEAAWENGEPRYLLRKVALDALPESSLIPLHTGAGLSLARRVLPEIEAPVAGVDAAVRHFDGLCRDNARDGFALACFEAMGLIVRQLAPDAAGDVDRALLRTGAGDRRRGAFWHGLGRGLYFVATQTLPGSTGRAVAKARREAPAGLPRVNALSGLAWAVTLVNLRQPAVVEDFLAAGRFTGGEESAVADGVASALLLWVDAAGREALFEGFLGYRPAAGAAADRWRRLVTEPCARALETWDDVKRDPGPGEIFHYRKKG